MNKATELKLMLEAVDDLAAAMKRKLRAKARAGKSGGLQPENREMVAQLLNEHVERLTGVCPHCNHAEDPEGDDAHSRQAVDVAALAMMLWVIGGSPE